MKAIVKKNEKTLNKSTWKNIIFLLLTLKLYEKLTISESHLPQTFEKFSPKPNKSNIKINSFLTNTRTPVDSFIGNIVKGKETLIPHVT